MRQIRGAEIQPLRRVFEHPVIFSISAISNSSSPIKSSGVMVPVITEAGKALRRKNILKKRRTCGKKCRPLPRLTKGAKGPCREFKVVEFHDETRKHTHQSLSTDLRTGVGIRIRREALRLNFRRRTSGSALSTAPSGSKPSSETARRG